MKQAKHGLWGLTLLIGWVATAATGQGWMPIERRLPPKGDALTTEARLSLTHTLASLDAEYGSKLLDSANRPDYEVLVDAVRLALRHEEFYKPNDAVKAARLLDLARRRAAELLESPDAPAYASQRGLLVRGYRSEIDGSSQPYGLVIPKELDLSRPVPLYVWLHGRGDTATNLHFIDERMRNVGQISPPGAIVLHPFGRHCIGFKSAGEIDVLDAVESVKRRYPIDPDRVVLMGFSMGGAGAWHIGAHYPDRWAAISPGAGFAETAQYNNLKVTADSPPRYEQALWGVYDVPCYVRNLFNLPVVAYSGEKDKQIQAARVMERAYAEHGRMLTHLIGPDKGHEYHPDTLKDILARLADAVVKGRDRHPSVVTLQTRTLRYNRVHWVQADAMRTSWRDAQIEARRLTDQHFTIDTVNVDGLSLVRPWAMPPRDGQVVVEIDSDRLVVNAAEIGEGVLHFESGEQGHWRRVESPSTSRWPRPGLHGPIDDAFLEPFLIVAPTGQAHHPLVEQWARFELAHCIDRWRAVYRGEPRVKRDVDVTDDDIARYHLVLFGDRASNKLLGRIADQLPIKWDERLIAHGDSMFEADHHALCMIAANPLNSARYIVLNSGPTHREAHDRTNSQQNPKLPDWAVIDLNTPPSDTAPGRVAAAGFFQ